MFRKNLNIKKYKVRATNGNCFVVRVISRDDVQGKRKELRFYYKQSGNFLRPWKYLAFADSDIFIRDIFAQFFGHCAEVINL